MEHPMTRIMNDWEEGRGISPIAVLVDLHWSK